MIYKVEFEGTLSVEAENAVEAELIVENNIGFCLDCEYFACEAYSPKELEEQ